MSHSTNHVVALRSPPSTSLSASPSIHDRIAGCLLGTAVGDAIGLPREGLSARRAEKLYGGAPLGHRLIVGRGMVSDDTEHAAIVARALVASGGDPNEFTRALARDLRKWLWCCPAGIGKATLRATLKLSVGVPASRSGVRSAGNGPAMRAALLGLCASNDEHLVSLNRACSRITHTDPRAEEGALVVAKAARAALDGAEPREILARLAHAAEGAQLRSRLHNAVHALDQRLSPGDFAKCEGWRKGVSGYVNDTVPAALYCWAHNPRDFRSAVESAVLLGGDSDSVGAITGAIAGAHLGRDSIPPEWLDGLIEWPRTVKWMTALADGLATAIEASSPSEPPRMRWLATLPRNAVFTAIVLAHGLRRLAPPY